ncbi:MAG: 2-deoxyribose-5-phosphate aldolase, partial [Caldisericum exile]
LLTQEEKIIASTLSVSAGANFVKTSTGFSTAGATVEDIQLIRSVVPSYIGVKASGGIRDYETAVKMVKAGATRIGASKSVEIVS